MYNLLKVSSQSHEEWEQNQGRLYDVSFLKGRVFEHTDHAVKRQLTGGDGPDFDALMRLPCLFTYEGPAVVGFIGRISEVRSDSRKLEIMYALPNTFPKIVIQEKEVFEALGMGTNRSERYRTHWAVKDVDLFEVTTRLLHEAGNTSTVLTEEEMDRVWGKGARERSCCS